MQDRPSSRNTDATASKAVPHEWWVGLVAVLVLAPVLLPLAVAFSQSLYFDIDPRRLAVLGYVEFGPAGSVWLAVASVLAAAIALAVTAWAGGRIRWWSCGLAVAGMIPCLVHVPEHFASRLHGSAWIAAVSLGLAAAHLGQFPRARRLIVSAVIAMSLPLFLQAAWYVFVDHPDTVRMFLEAERENLAARGIAYGSAAHAKYLTRLQGSDVIGAVGMSNVLGSIVSAITMSGLVCLIGAWRQRAGWWRIGALAAVVSISGWTLVLTESKGALLALMAVMGLGVVVLMMLRFKWMAVGRRVLPSVFVLCVLAGMVVVLARGAAGPPDGPDGERSLLFRFHYWQGAARMLTDEPSRVLAGVGPGTFQDKYEAVRNPISPEVVSSTHNVFVDYIVMLGVGGIAWCGLLLMWLWNAGSAVGGRLADQAKRERGPPGFIEAQPPVKLFSLLAAIVFGIQLYVQYPGLYAPTAILWLVGTLGFVALASSVIYPALSSGSAWWGLALGLSAVLLLLHAQIEMTFFWDSAAGFVWVLVGLASAKCVRNDRAGTNRPARFRYLPATCLLLLSMSMAVFIAVPTQRDQVQLQRASEALRSAGTPAALIELDRAATIIANDPTTTRWRVQLRKELAAILTANGQIEGAEALLGESLTVLDEAERAGLGHLSSTRRKGMLMLDAYAITGERAWLRRAIEPLTSAVSLSPNGLNDHVRLADTLWQLGEFGSAQQTYRRALQISDNYYLGPDAQLPEDQRRRIEARLGGGESQ